MKNFIAGFNYFMQGFSLIKTKGIRRYVIIPLLINVVLYAILIWLGIHYFTKLTEIFMAHMPNWLQWLVDVLWVIFIISILLLALISFNILANIVAAPFNGFLSTKLQLQLTRMAPDSGDNLVQATAKTVLRQLQFVAYYLPRMLLMLILFFIPIIHLAYPVLWFMFNAWMMSLQYFDYPMDNNGVDFKRMKSWMREHSRLSLGFGFAVGIFNLIPLINFIVMPTAVCGATLMWLEQT